MYSTQRDVTANRTTKAKAGRKKDGRMKKRREDFKEESL